MSPMTNGRLRVRPDQLSLDTPDHARQGESIGNSCYQLMTPCPDIQQSMCQWGSLAGYEKFFVQCVKISGFLRYRREIRRQRQVASTISTD